MNNIKLKKHLPYEPKSHVKIGASPGNGSAIADILNVIGT